MYGRSFESMYDGSMVGAGVHIFAVWNYVIAKTRRGVIELNPVLLAFILGGTQKEVEEAIEFLCSEDKKSRTKVEGGRRLVKEGQFQYRVVNWEKYNGIKNELDRREYNRVKQQEYRATQKKPKKETKSDKEPESTDVDAKVRSFENGHIDENGQPIKSEEPPPTVSDIRAELVRQGI